MKNVSRRLGTVLLGAFGLALVGCSGTGKPAGSSEEKVGNLALPLVTQGASGITYRLRDATFVVQPLSYYGYGGGPAMAGSGGTGSSPGSVTVSSETDPNAPTISLSLEEGQYYVQLLPGWHFEKDGPTGAEPVQATLLSGETQWVWISRHSTSFAEFEFGLGDRTLWLNGELNIGVVLHEDPSEIAGTGGTYVGGSGGFTGGAGGFFTGGTGGTGALPSGGSVPID